MKRAVRLERDHKHLSVELVEYMKEKLKLTKIKEKRKLTTEEQIKWNTFPNKKVRILNEIIFPAMADLTFFFQAISENPELYEIFASDIKELLGIRRRYPEQGNYAFMFTNLVGGMMAVRNSQTDFSVKLMHKLMGLIWTKMLGLKIFDTITATTNVFEDIDRVRAWTELIESRVPDDYDFTKRTSRYDKKELDKCKTEAKRKAHTEKGDKLTKEEFQKYVEAEQKKYMERIDKKTKEEFQKYVDSIKIARLLDFDTNKILNEERLSY